MEHPNIKCAKCGQAHSGECIQGTNSCYGCGKSGTWSETVHRIEVRQEVMLSLGQTLRVQ